MTIHEASFKPRSAVSGSLVTVPTLVVETPREDGKPAVLLQWFGECSDLSWLVGEEQTMAKESFNASQFRFLVSDDASDIHWMGHPELFRVVSIGQVKDWPNPSIQKQLDSPECWILYIASTHYTMTHPNGRGVPECLLIPLRVFPAEQIYGIISPRKYQGPPAV